MNRSLCVLCVLCGFMAFDCQAVFNDYQVAGLQAPVHYYAERPLEDGGDEELAVVIVHGYGDGVALPDEAPVFREAAAKRLGPEGKLPYIIAPMFPTPKTLAKFKCDDTARARWNDSMNEENGYRCLAADDWRGGGDADNAPGLSSFDVVDRIFAELGARFPKLKRVVLAGYSAGGQYSSRYAAVGRGFVRDGVTVEYAPMAPSTWLWLDDKRWHYGLSDRPRYSAALTREQIEANLASRRQWCGCGEFDIKGRLHTSLDMQPEAVAQGTNRFERFKSFREHVRGFPAWNRRCSFFTFRGIHHEYRKAYAFPEFVNFVLGLDSTFSDGYSGIEHPAAPGRR